jgi:hypothetical protein
MTRDESLPLNPPFTLLSPLRRDADARATEAYLPHLYPSNEVLPRQELGPSYWMERRSRYRLLSKYRSFDIFYGGPGAMPADNKNVLGASLASISSILAEQGSDEYAASQDVFEYTTLDTLVTNTLVQSSTEEMYVCWAAIKLLLQKRVQMKHDRLGQVQNPMSRHMSERHHQCLLTFRLLSLGTDLVVYRVRFVLETGFPALFQAAVSILGRPFVSR